MVASRTTKINLSRFEPYPSGGTTPEKSNEDKENQSSPVNENPSGDKSETNQEQHSKQQPPPAKSKSPSAHARKDSKNDSDRSDLPASYLDIPLEEIKDEVPCYENVKIFLSQRV